MTPNKQKLGLIVLCISFATAAGISMWVYQRLATPEAPAGGEHEAPPVPIAQDDEEGIKAIGVIAGVRKGPELELTSGGKTIDLGTVAYGENEVRTSVRLRHAGGRPDPITMTQMRVELAEGAPQATLPLLVPGRSQCMSESYEQAEDGTYCEITLRWTPQPGETLNAVLSARINPWEKRDLVIATEYIADRPGGWPTKTLRLDITGTAQGAPPAAEITLDVPRIEWEAEPGGRAETPLTITVRNRTVRITSISIDPPIDGTAVLDGALGKCTTQFDPDSTCPFYLRWLPTKAPPELSAQVTEHDLVIGWRAIDRHGRQEPLKTTRTLIVRTLLPPGAREARIATRPTVVKWEQFTIGRVTETIELLIEVEEAPITVESIGTNPQAQAHEVRIENADSCTRLYRPRRETNIDWCRLLITARPRSETMEDAAIIIEWSRGRGTDALRDRYELVVKLSGTGREIDRTAPAILRTDPEGLVALGVARSTTTQIRRLTMRNIGGVVSRLKIESVGIVTENEANARGLNISGGDCQGRTLSTTDFCDIELSWTPGTNTIIDANLEVKWNGGAGRERTNIAITGQGPPQERLAPVASPETIARELFKQRRAQNAAGRGWHVDAVAYAARTQPPRGTLRLIDEDHSKAGQEWIKSTRPTPLHTVILPNTPIPAVLMHEINAVYSSPVIALVERDVWSSGPQRTKIIPRGARLEGNISGLNTGSTNAQVNGSEVRVMVQWRTLIRPDGAMFAVGTGSAGSASLLATTDLMSRAGLPARVDPYELENWIGIMGAAAIDALLILAGPEITYSESTTVTNNETVTNTQRTPTKRELAWSELRDGINQVGAVMQAFTRPLPSIIVPAGTRMRLYPQQGLVLRPIEYEEPEPPPPTNGEPGTNGETTGPPGSTTTPLPPQGNQGNRPAADDGGAPDARPYWETDARERGQGLRIQTDNDPSALIENRPVVEREPLPLPPPKETQEEPSWLDIMTTPTPTPPTQ